MMKPADTCKQIDKTKFWITLNHTTSINRTFTLIEDATQKFGAQGPYLFGLLPFPLPQQPHRRGHAALQVENNQRVQIQHLFPW